MTKVFEPLSGEHKDVKPCPFCGGLDIDIKIKDSGNIMLHCTNCGALGPNWDYREERAIFSWNDRPVINPQSKA